MIGHHREPTLEEILSDSVTKAIMEADGVDRQELEAMLRQAGRNLPPLRGGERLVPRHVERSDRRIKSRASDTEGGIALKAATETAHLGARHSARNGPANGNISIMSDMRAQAGG